MPEGIADGLFRLVVIPIAHIDALSVFHVSPAKGVSGDHILIGYRPRLCQLAGGICFSGQQVGNSLTACLSRQPHVQDRLDFVRPGQFHGAAAQQHHHRIGVCRSHCFDHPVVALRQSHMLPIQGFGFIGVREARHHHGDTMGPGCPSRFLQGGFCYIALRITAVREENAGKRVRQIHQLCGIDMAAAAALIPNLLRHVADEYHIRCTQR